MSTPAANQAAAKPAAAPAPAAKQPKPVDKAKEAAKAAAAQKRAARLTEIKAKDPIRFACVISFREAKQLNVAADWKAYCALKAKAFSDLWLKRAEQKVVSEKSLERKKSRVEKLRAMLAALEKEIA